MSEEVRLKIFEPFFTTKSEGMGLAVVHGIIEEHGRELQNICCYTRLIESFHQSNK